jgi:hypothetical protein
LQTGKVTGQEIKANRDGGVDVRLLQVNLNTDQRPDIHTVQYFPMSGDDSPPQNDDTVLVMSIGQSFKVAIAVQDSVVPSMLTGEKKSYSRDSSGDIAAFINFLTGGDLELNGNAYTAVRFAVLETQFNELRDAYNGHTHPPGTAVNSPNSAADLSGAESPTVKLL